MISTFTILNHLATIGSFISLFTTFDLLSSQKVKERISWFIFGYSGFSLTPYFRNILDSILLFFIMNGRIRRRRIFTVSAFMFLIFGHNLVWKSILDVGLNVYSAIALFPVGLLFGAALSFPFDFLQTWIVKKLFGDFRNLSGRALFLRFLSLLILSPLVILPIASLINLIWMMGVYFQGIVIFYQEPCLNVELKTLEPMKCYIAENLDASRASQITEIFMFLGFATLISTFSAIFSVSFIALTFLTGVSLQVASGFFKMSNFVSQHSDVHRYPFTVLGVIIALTSYGFLIISHFSI